MLSFFFLNDTATTEIYTLSLHDALPIFRRYRAQYPGTEHLGHLHHQRARASRRGVHQARVASLQRKRGMRQVVRSEEHTSELQSPCNIVCRLLLEKKKELTHACVIEHTR